MSKQKGAHHRAPPIQGAPNGPERRTPRGRGMKIEAPQNFRAALGRLFGYFGKEWRALVISRTRDHHLLRPPSARTGKNGRCDHTAHRALARHGEALSRRCSSWWDLRRRMDRRGLARVFMVRASNRLVFRLRTGTPFPPPTPLHVLLRTPRSLATSSRASRTTSR